MYEIKAPTGSKTKTVERNIVRALAKCPNIIFDSSRMKMKDETIKRLLVSRFKQGKGIKSIIFITKRRKIINISKKYNTIIIRKRDSYTASIRLP